MWIGRRVGEMFAGHPTLYTKCGICIMMYMYVGMYVYVFLGLVCLGVLLIEY